MKFVTKTYGTPKSILKFADHFVAIDVMVSDEGITADENGRKIVPAGTIVGGKAAPTLKDPAQEVVEKNTTGVATGEAGSAVDAEGVLLNDVDVTYGLAGGAMLIHGYVDATKIPDVPVAEAIVALKQISFIN